MRFNFRIEIYLFNLEIFITPKVFKLIKSEHGFDKVIFQLPPKPKTTDDDDFDPVPF